MTRRPLALLALFTLAARAQDPDALRARMAQARAKVFPCLVHIVNVEEVFSGGERKKGVSTGSGFFIDAEGHLVTNFHVAGQAERLFVTLPNRRKVKAVLVAGDPYTDLAVLRVDPKLAFEGREPVFATFGDSTKLQEGDFVMAMGSPLSLSRSVSFGIISCRERLLGSMSVAGHETGKYNTWLQTDAAINPGNSGGPLVDLRGEVVGVNTRANLAANNIGFAIPSQIVKEVVEALLKHGSVPRSYLGVTLQPLDAVEHTLLGSVREGVLVAAVAADSPAAGVGVRPGDFITGLDGKPFSAQFDEEIPGLYRRISKLARDKPAKLEILRRDRAIEVEVKPVPLGRDVGRQREVKAWGITVRAITQRMVRDLRLPDAKGVQVTGVRAGSAAAGRLDAGDIILRVQGHEVGDLAGFLALAARGDSFVRLVLRRGNVLDVTVLKPTARKKGD